MMPQEVAEFSGEIIELREGEFRYWFYSDVVAKNAPTYPLSGKYMVDKDRLILIHDRIHENERVIDVVNEKRVLWRDDALRSWREQKKVLPFGVLIWASDVEKDLEGIDRPSVYALYTDDLHQRDAEEYERLLREQPNAVRRILRARNFEGDTTGSIYLNEIHRARERLDSNLVGQLVGLIEDDSPLAVQARNILREIYEGSPVKSDEPSSSKGDKWERENPLKVLIDAMSHLQDRAALEDVLFVFLATAELSKVDLVIPEAGVHIRLTYLSDGTREYASIPIKASPHSPESVRWIDKMELIIPKCQEWCRQQLE